MTVGEYIKYNQPETYQKLSSTRYKTTWKHIQRRIQYQTDKIKKEIKRKGGSAKDRKLWYN